jgi:hypothetical protein
MQFSPVFLFLSLAFAVVLPRQGYEAAIAKTNTDLGLAPQVEKFIEGSGPIITGEGAGGISKRGIEAAIATTNSDLGLIPQVEKFVDGSGPAITGEGAGGVSK